MGSFSERINDIDKAIKDLRNNRSKDSLKTTADALALVKRRVIQSGQSATGAAFSPYSRGYAEVRSSAGRPAGFKNFSFTGDMWKRIVPVLFSNTTDTTLIVFGSKDSFTQFKHDVNSQRENIAITALSKSELEFLSDLNEQRFLRILRLNNLL